MLQRALLICGYATILGTISEDNFLNICAYADVDEFDENVINVVNYYYKAKLVDIRPGKEGFVKILDLMPEITIDSNDETLRFAKQFLERIRRETED